MSTRNDIPHYSVDEVEANLAAALALVDGIAPPAELRGEVFRRASEMLGAKTVQIVQPERVPFSLDNLPSRL